MPRSPQDAKQDAKQNANAPRTTRRGKLARAIHPKHPFWGKVLAFLDGVWGLLGFLVGTVLLGGLIVNIILSFATNGTPGITNPATWPATKLLTADLVHTALGVAIAILVILAAYLAHRIRANAPESDVANEYVLTRVDRLDPARYVPVYVPEVYLPRHEADGADADEKARAALRAAAKRPDPTAPTGPLGICAFGRPTQGKTRMAWDTMRAVLPDWTFVRWPLGRPQLPLSIAKLHGGRVVLWLDDLQKYGADEANTLADLPRRFAEEDVRLVVVATCRDGQDEKDVRGRLRGLLGRLTEVRPADISRAEADRLAGELRQQGTEVYMDEFDRTPGSLLLRVDRMRDEIYPRLSPDARHVLWALKLLRSAGIYEYPAPRVRALAAAVFGLAPASWRDACNALADASFVRLGEADAEGERALEVVADVYLDEAVPDYPPSAPNASAADDWPALQRVLTEQRDAGALNNLGIAYNVRPLGDRRSNQQHAIECHRSALDIYERASDPIGRARTQVSLANALAALAQLSEGRERSELSEKAVDTYRDALTVSTRAAAPADWAMTQNNLATALRDQAGFAEGEERARLLGEAVTAYRDALQVRTRAAAPAQWAATQFNLALLYRDRAQDAVQRADACADLGEARQCAESARSGFEAVGDPTNFKQATQLVEEIAVAMREAGCG